MRTTLADRPGALARLAQCCGEREVNILALQIFPDVGGVTDELVLATPGGWRMRDVAGLVEEAGGRDVAVCDASDHSLTDAPTRYLQAVRQVHAAEIPVEEVLAHLLEGTVSTDGPESLEHSLALEVVGRRVVVRRTAPFTPTEHARAAAFAELAEAVAGAGSECGAVPDPQAAVQVRPGRVGDHVALQRMHARCSAATVYHRFGVPLLRLNERLARRLVGLDGESVLAMAGEEVVGLATVARRGGGTTPELSVLVEDAWQGRGVGTRLVHAATRMLAREGYRGVLLRGQADNPGMLALVTGLGLTVRVRMAGDALTALVGIADLPVPTAGDPVTVGGAAAEVVSAPV
ncbi:MAG: GNAT family N-acetyltransferase [Nocardioides sp.]|nr:GNAT family N-acetyltransferase [Nocardioides sp.]